MDRFFKTKGVTLIELIIVLALISLIGVGAFSVFQFGNTTYKKGVNQYDVQADQRIIAEVISDNLRYAYDIEILDDIRNEDDIKITDNSNTLFGYSYIYLKYSDDNSDGVCEGTDGIEIRKVIFDRATSSYTSTVISNTTINSLIYKLTFNYDGKRQISFDLISENKGKEIFKLNTKVNIMNSHFGSMPTIPTGETSVEGTAIRFKLDPNASSGVALPDSPPEISNVSINGTGDVFHQLTGLYDCTSDNSNYTLNFRWERKLLGDVEWTVISGANSDTYTLTGYDYQNIIRFVVIPCTLSGDPFGEPQASPPTGEITFTGITRPSADSLTIDSTVKKQDYAPGVLLSANYSFSSDNYIGMDTLIDNSIIRWYKIKIVNDKGTKTEIKEELVSEPGSGGRSYILKSDDSTFNIYFTVEPIDGFGMVGDIVESDHVGPIK